MQWDENIEIKVGCSDQHEWFQKALKDPDGEYAEKFYFRKGHDGKAPSNYRSYFGGNMWEPVEGYEDLYYYHSFASNSQILIGIMKMF